MPEYDHVRGIEYEGGTPAGTIDKTQYPDYDNITANDRRIGPLADPDAASTRYFLETKSRELEDIVVRDAADDEE